MGGAEGYDVSDMRRLREDAPRGLSGKDGPVSIGDLHVWFFKWSCHWQLDIHIPRVRGWWSFGFCWKRWCGCRPHMIAAWSPDATPSDQQKGWNHVY
jgi:hypothetical protein